MEKEQIKELRLSQGLLQREFAKLLGVNKQTVWRWENGVSSPRPVQAWKLDEMKGK